MAVTHDGAAPLLPGAESALVHTEHESSALTDAVPAPDSLVTATEHHQRQVLRDIGYVLATAAIFGGAYAGAEEAPPLQTSVAGIQVTVHQDIGHDVSRLDAPNGGTLILPKHIELPLTHRGVGFTAVLDGQNIPVTNAAHQLDYSRITEYAKSFPDLRPEEAKLVTAEERNLALHAGLGAGVVVLAELGLLGACKFYRFGLSHMSDTSRDEFRHKMRPVEYGVPLMSGLVALGLVTNMGVGLAGPTHHTRIVADPTLTGTPLEGSQLTGALQPVVDQAVPYIKNVLDGINNFYDGADAQVLQLIKGRYGAATIPKPKGIKRYIIMDDTQGRIGMMRVSGTTAKAVDADGIINLGDTGFTGTAADEPIIAELRYYAGKDMKITDGESEHDTAETAKLQQGQHEQIANDDIQKFAGLSVLGANVPLHSVPGAGPLKQTGESIDELTQQMVAKACAKHPDIFFSHFSVIADAVAASGCVPMSFGGRSYSARGPTSLVLPTGTSYEYVSGSTGALEGADGPSVGVQTNQSILAYFDFAQDAAGKWVPIDYSTLTVSPETENNVTTPHVALSPAISLNARSGKQPNASK